MEYRNKRTGIVFCSNSDCEGEDWELLSPTPKPAKEEIKKTVSKGKAAKKDK